MGTTPKKQLSLSSSNHLAEGYWTVLIGPRQTETTYFSLSFWLPTRWKENILIVQGQSLKVLGVLNRVGDFWNKLFNFIYKAVLFFSRERVGKSQLCVIARQLHEELLAAHLFISFLACSHFTPWFKFNDLNLIWFKFDLIRWCLASNLTSCFGFLDLGALYFLFR